MNDLKEQFLTNVRKVFTQKPVLLLPFNLLKPQKIIQDIYYNSQ